MSSPRVNSALAIKSRIMLIGEAVAGSLTFRTRRSDSAPQHNIDISRSVLWERYWLINSCGTLASGPGLELNPCGAILDHVGNSRWRIVMGQRQLVPQPQKNRKNAVAQNETRQGA